MYVPIRTGAATSPTAQHGPLPVPVPAQPISIRVAEMRDFAFIDALQKQHTKMVGWMPRQQLETYITNGDVLVAEGSAGAAVPGMSGVIPRVIPGVIPVPPETGIQGSRGTPSDHHWTPAPRNAGVTEPGAIPGVIPGAGGGATIGLV